MTNKIFYPGIAIINRLKYWQKFSLIFLIFIVPLVGANAMLTINSLNEIKLSHQQRAGLAYIVKLQELIQHFQQHRGLVAVYKGGNAGIIGNLQEKQEQIALIVKDIDQLEQQYGHELKSRDHWNALKGEWEHIVKNMQSFAGEESFLLHTQLISAALYLNSQIAEYSNLLIDPDQAINRLARTAFEDLLYATEYMGQSRAIGSLTLGEKRLSAENETKLTFLTGSIEEKLNTAKRNIAMVINSSRNEWKNVGEAYENAVSSASKLIFAIKRDILGSSQLTMDSGEFYNLATASVDQVFALIKAETGTIDALLTERINKLTFENNLFLSAVGLLMLFVVYFFISFYISVKKSIYIIEEGTNRIVVGDLTKRINLPAKDETKRIESAVNEMIAAFQKVIAANRKAASTIAESSRELSAIIEQTTRATEDITHVIQEVTTGAEAQIGEVERGRNVFAQIAEDINNIAETSHTAAQASQENRQQAEKGNEAIRKITGQMNAISQSVSQSAAVIGKLSKSSEQIEKIVEVITGIAGQTNLLALNAAIEAARAGEQGKGFSVVANEVRVLAEQAAASSNEIVELIRSVQVDIALSDKVMKETTENVQQGLQMVNEAGTAFNQIVASTQNVTERLAMIDALGQRISAGAKNLAQVIGEVRMVSEKTATDTQHVSSSVQELLAAMEEITVSAESLSRIADDLQQEISRYKIS